MVRPLLKNTTGLFADLRPGFAALRQPKAKQAADAVAIGVKALRVSPGLNRQLDPTAQALLDFNNNPNVRGGLADLDDFFGETQPLLSLVAPAQSVCNYATLLFKNVANHLSFGDGIGTYQRFIALDPPLGPNSEGTPAQRPGRRRRRRARQLPALQPLSEHRVARARSASARPATRPTSPGVRSRSETCLETRES